MPKNDLLRKLISQLPEKYFEPIKVKNDPQNSPFHVIFYSSSYHLVDLVKLRLEHLTHSCQTQKSINNSIHDFTRLFKGCFYALKITVKGKSWSSFSTLIGLKNFSGRWDMNFWNWSFFGIFKPYIPRNSNGVHFSKKCQEWGNVYFFLINKNISQPFWLRELFVNNVSLAFRIKEFHCRVFFTIHLGLKRLH